MPSIWRQLPLSKLVPDKQKAKLQKDKEYKQAVESLSSAFYAKKHTTGVTAEEQATYTAAKRQLWDSYQAWAIANGLYEEVIAQKQLEETASGLDEQVQRVNALRAELGLGAIRVV